MLLPSISSVLCAQSPVLRRWDFERSGDTDGWTLPPRLRSAVMGGALWVHGMPRATNPKDFLTVNFQLRGRTRPDPAGALVDEIVSPAGLGISAATATKVCLRIRNLSPATDGFVTWRVASAPRENAGTVRFSMRPNHGEWQDVTCHVDGRWQGIIDQITIRIANTMRGDVWFDAIEITGGDRREPQRPPEFDHPAVVPRVHIPGVSQADFADAFRVMKECVVTEVPAYGFPHPFLSPGGRYAEMWWQLDTSVTLGGVQWVDPEFAENVVRGFHAVQAENSDGRIDWQGDAVVRGQVADLSTLPRYFEAAYDVARRTRDVEFREQTYASMRKYLDWWLNPRKRHAETGLIMGIGEETFGDPAARAQQPIAPVDLNVAVAVGLHNTARLGRVLGRDAEALAYERTLAELKAAMNREMWSEARGAYFNYNVRERQLRERMLCTTFDPFRLRLAPPDRVQKLIGKLVDPELFNWGKLPLTSIARTEAEYNEHTGSYNPVAWIGDVWTLRNMMVISGLEDVGRHDLAAELAWATIKAFNGRYAEFLVPSTGEGHGVQRYGWTASQYIQIIIEHLFGVDWDSIAGRLQVFPHIPAELEGKELSISRLKLPNGAGTRVAITTRKAASGATEVRVEIDGDLPAGVLEIFAPDSSPQHMRVRGDDGRELPVIRAPGRLAKAIGVSLPIRRFTHVTFQPSSALP